MPLPVEGSGVETLMDEGSNLGGAGRGVFFLLFAVAVEVVLMVLVCEILGVISSGGCGFASEEVLRELAVTSRSLSFVVASLILNQ